MNRFRTLKGPKCNAFEFETHTESVNLTNNLFTLFRYVTILLDTFVVLQKM